MMQPKPVVVPRPTPHRRSPVVTPVVIEQALQTLSPRRSLLLLMALQQGAASYSELERRVTDIPKPTLSRRLTELVDAGLITRTVRNTKPVSVAYTLTAKGEQVKLVTDAIEAWLSPARSTRLAG